MNRIPPDVNQLMWSLADDPNPEALNEFEKRYPAYVGELGKRIDMVRRMRGAQSPTSRKGGVPAFHPVPLKPDWPRAAAASSFAIALTALAVASYFATRWYLNRDAAVPPVIVEQPVLEAPEQPKVALAPPRRFEAPRPPQPRSETEQMSPLSVRLEKVPLSTALQAIAQQAGLRVTLAPGFERIDATVDVDLAQVRPMEAFETLGRTYGFTAFYQGNREVLVIPAPSTGTASAGGEPAPTELPEEPPPLTDDIRRTAPIGSE